MVVFGKGGFCGICFPERWPRNIFYHGASVCTLAEIGAPLIAALTLCASGKYQRLSCKGSQDSTGLFRPVLEGDCLKTGGDGNAMETLTELTGPNRTGAWVCHVSGCPSAVFRV